MYTRTWYPGAPKAKDVDRTTKDCVGDNYANCKEDLVQLPVALWLLSERQKLSESDIQIDSGQAEELASISGAAKEAAKTIPDLNNRLTETTEKLQAGIRSNSDRISTLDDYEIKRTVTIYFKSGSSEISKEAMATLDSFAENSPRRL